MGLQIDIDTGNVAFEDNGACREVASILRELAQQFADLGDAAAEIMDGHRLWDSKGQQAGTVWAR